MTSPPPDLEMLWETADPQQVLTDRFGHPDASTAAEWVVDTVREHWGVRHAACERIVMSDHNALAWLTTDSDALIAKWSTDEDRFGQLDALSRLMGKLAEQGQPVSAPLVSAQGTVQVELEAVSMGVQRVVRGALLDTDEVADVSAAGRSLAGLHDALAAHGPRDLALRGPAGTLRERIGRWRDAYADRGPADAWEVLARLVERAPSEALPQQVVHGDVRSANILCEDGEVTAFLDFEEARMDHRVVELARGAVMLGTRYHDWGPVSARVRAAFVSAYASVRPLTEVEQAWWPALELWCALAMVPEGTDPTGWADSASEIARSVAAPG